MNELTTKFCCLYQMFAPTADIALEPLRCALLVPTKKAELWVQGTLTFDVIAFDFVGDLPVFDHLIQVWAS